MGTRSAWAKAFAVAIPTRRPVKSPGPMSTATALTSRRLMLASRHTNWIAGASVSAWRRPRAAWNSARTPSTPPTAQPTWTVAVSMPRTIIDSGPGPTPERGGQRPLARRPGRAHRVEVDDPLVVPLGPVQPHLEEVGGQRGSGHVSPLDHGDRALVDELRQRQVDDLLEEVETVDVGVDEPNPAGVDAHEREAGAGDRLLDPQRPPEALGG